MIGSIPGADLPRSENLSSNNVWKFVLWLVYGLSFVLSDWLKYFSFVMSSILDSFSLLGVFFFSYLHYDYQTSDHHGWCQRSGHGIGSPTRVTLVGEWNVEMNYEPFRIHFYIPLCHMLANTINTTQEGGDPGLCQLTWKIARDCDEARIPLHMTCEPHYRDIPLTDNQLSTDVSQ